MWPFTRRERRQSDDFTGLVSDVLERATLGTGANARAVAVVEAAILRWQAPFAQADVSGLFGPRLKPWLPHIVRSLGTSGNAVLLLNDGTLSPAIYGTVTGGPQRASWMYHVDEVMPDGSAHKIVRSDSLLHFTINSSIAAPWTGRSPLSVASETSSALAEIEKRVSSAAQQPAVSVLQFNDEVSQEQGADLRTQLQEAGIKGRPMVLSNGGKGDSIEPPFGASTRDLRQSLEASILLAFGIHPMALAEVPNGAAMKEAARQFHTTVLGPIAGMISQEVLLKTGIETEIDLSKSRFQNHLEAARSVKALFDAGFSKDEAAIAVGLEVGNAAG